MHLVTVAILKNRKMAISQQQIVRSARNLARWRIFAMRTILAVKISNVWKSKMADDRHFDKSKIAISPQLIVRSAPNLALWCILTIKTVPMVKISNFWKSNMADGRHLEISKNDHISTTNRQHNDAFWLSELYWQLNFWSFKNLRWRTTAILKTDILP